jgi:hypothetical protein
MGQGMYLHQVTSLASLACKTKCVSALTTFCLIRQYGGIS